MPNHNKPTNGLNKNPQNINRNGRPKREWSWAGLLEQAAEVEEDKVKRKEIVVNTLYKLCKQGDMTACKEIMNRTDGMPKQSTDLDVTTKGQPITNSLLANVLENDSTKESGQTHQAPPSSARWYWRL